MSEVNSVGGVGRVAGVGPSVGRDVHVKEDETVRRGTDRVEVSQVSVYLSKLNNLPVRQELVDSVRDQIARGTYDTPEKLDLAIGEMLGDQAS